MKGLKGLLHAAYVLAVFGAIIFAGSFFMESSDNPEIARFSTRANTFGIQLCLVAFVLGQIYFIIKRYKDRM